MKEKICTKCGELVNKDDKYCACCGALLAEETLTAKEDANDRVDSETEIEVGEDVNIDDFKEEILVAEDMEQKYDATPAKFLSFKGRLNRKEGIFQSLKAFVGYFVAFLIFNTIQAEAGSINLILIIAFVAMFYFQLASISIMVRRLHDRGNSGWWVLFTQLPLVGLFVIIYILASNSKPEGAKYGLPRMNKY